MKMEQELAARAMIPAPALAITPAPTRPSARTATPAEQGTARAPLLARVPAERARTTTPLLRNNPASTINRYNGRHGHRGERRPCNDFLFSALQLLLRNRLMSHRPFRNLHLGRHAPIFFVRRQFAHYPLLGLKFDWNADAFTAGPGLEHGKVQVRAAGETGIAGQCDQIAGVHTVADLHLAAAFFQMRVDADGPVRMLDQNDVGAFLIFAVRPADA